MTQEQVTKPCQAEPPVAEPNIVTRKSVNVEEIVESFKCVGEDIEQIGRLNSEEKLLVAEFLEWLLKHMSPLASSIEVSKSVLPIKLGAVSQAFIDPTGHLTLTFEDGYQELLDLSEIKYRDLLMAVIDDFMVKFNTLTSQISNVKESNVLPEQVPLQVQEIPAPQLPALEPPPTISVETPIDLPDLAPPEVPEEPIPEEAPVLPDLSVDTNAKIAEITSETLNYLEMLGNEVFEQAPVSKYFDDWMVNLRQIILSFESSDVIGPEENFTKEYNQIFGDIEDELANRIANEADIAVSARTLVENRYLLNKIDEGYAAQTKDLVVKGKNAIEYLMRNMQNIERELAEVEQIKTSYRHPLQKMAKDQKISELTQKLNAAKKRLAMAVGTSSVDKAKSGDIDAEFADQSQELEEKRKIAMDFLTQNVKELQDQIEEIKKNKTSNPLKRVANQQQIFEFTEKLLDAKKRLLLAEQNSSFEQEKLRAEYEKKKQATVGKMQSIEKDIATKTIDDSLEARQAAVKALADAVKSLIQRKTAVASAS